MAGNNSNNLDLSDISNEDQDTLAQRICTFYKNDSTTKNSLSYKWERNSLMLDGKHWLTFESDTATGGMWKRLRVSSRNEYIPRPVTNYLFDIYQTLKSYLIKQKPRSVVKPNTQQHKDKAAAKIATMILEGNWVKLKEQYNYETAAANLLTYGTVFKKSYWDTSSQSTVKVPRMIQQPITDPLTSAIMGMQEVIATDPATGDELFDELPLGDLATTILEPYRFTLDPLAMHLHEARWVLEYSIQSLDWIKETYSKDPETSPGYTGRADEVKEETDLNGSLRRWYQLRTTSGTRDGSLVGSSGVASSDSMIENAAVVKEYYERPSFKFPKGRLVVVAGNICLYAGDSPYEGDEAGDWHPYSECRWEIVPGRFWGKSPLDDAVEIQKQINSIDSAIILTRKTMAMPQKLIPMGSGISPGTFSGRPGQEVYYRPDGGAAPTTVPAAGVHESVFKEREQRLSDMKDISGAIDILRGDRPPGVNAASALNMLYEVGTGKIYPVLDRWKMFIEEDQKKQLKLVATKYKEPRPQFIKMLKSLNTELSDLEINQFLGTDLHDNYNVRIEANSNIPKLESARDARKMELAQMGVLQLDNPLNRSQFLQDMGIDGYDTDVGPDQKRAQWENDMLDNLPQAPGQHPIVLAIDNHELHIMEHSNRMKAPAFISMDSSVQQAYMQHIQQHEQFQAMALQAQMMNEHAMRPPEGASAPKQNDSAQRPGNPGGSPQHQSAATRTGPPAAVKQAVAGADILNASTIGAQG